MQEQEQKIRIRRRGSGVATRMHELTIRLAPDEMGSVRTTAAAAGMSMADLARKQLIAAGANIALSASERSLKARKINQTDPALVRQIAMIGNNLNQIARKINGQSSIEVVQLLTQLSSIQNDLKSLIQSK